MACIATVRYETSGGTFMCTGAYVNPEGEVLVFPTESEAMKFFRDKTGGTAFYYFTQRWDRTTVIVKLIELQPVKIIPLEIREL